MRIWDGDDGMVHLYGQFDPVTGRRIRSRLNKTACRLLDADNKDNKHAGAGGEKRSLSQCMADALDDMTTTTAGGGKPYADIALVARLDTDTEKLFIIDDSACGAVTVNGTGSPQYFNALDLGRVNSG